MHSFTFNGHSSEEFGIRIERFPDLNRSERKYRSASVAGRNGNIYQMQNAWEEVTVSYQIFAGERAAGAAVTDFTDIVEWLNSADDYAVLTDSYDPAHYRLAVFVDDLDIESEWHTFGKATIKFRCRPQRYLNEIASTLPRLDTGTYSGSSMTVAVNSDGIATMSGTSSAESGTVSVPFSTTYAVDSSQTNSKIKINNTVAINGAVIKLCKRTGSNIYPVYTIPLDSVNKTIQVPESLIGETLYCIYVVATAGTTLSGTINPEIIKISPMEIDVADGDTVTNPTNHTAYPTITLQGGGAYGVRSLLNLNNLTLSNRPNTGSSQMDEVIQDARNEKINFIKYSYIAWSGSIAYSYNYAGSLGTSGSITSIDNSTGTISFTPESATWGLGLVQEVLPNSAYSLSFTASAAGRVIVWYGSSLNYNAVILTSSNTFQAGSTDYTINTPTECGYILIGFYADNGGAVTFSSIMLNVGTTPQPFRPWGEDQPETISIGDVSIKIYTSGFNTAVIDCDNENILIDGVENNSAARVLDQYGNVSVNFLHLPKGTSTVGISSGITSAKMVPNFWEL